MFFVYWFLSFVPIAFSRSLPPSFWTSTTTTTTVSPSSFARQLSSVSLISLLLFELSTLCCCFCCCFCCSFWVIFELWTIIRHYFIDSLLSGPTLNSVYARTAFTELRTNCIKKWKKCVRKITYFHVITKKLCFAAGKNLVINENERMYLKNESLLLKINDDKICVEEISAEVINYFLTKKPNDTN